jgi:hypothetical protein
MLQLVSCDVRNVTLCYYYEINLILHSPFPFTVVATTIVVVLLCSPFPPTAIAATILVIPFAAIVVHSVPTLFQASPILGTPPFFALRRGGWGAVAAHLTLAAVAKEVHETPFLLNRFPELLLCLLHGDEYNAVTLGVHLTKLVLHPVGGELVFHCHDRHAGALLFEVPHHRRTPKKALLGAHVLVAHLHP